jgi:hypothetical protein
MDFHDVSSVLADPEGKQQHVVEILNAVDHGSSAVVLLCPGSYTAETAFGRSQTSPWKKAAPLASA